MDLKSAIDHIKRSTVPTDKWKADDFIADNCPPEAGEMEAAFAAIMNAVADGALAQNHEGIISRLSEKVNTLITEKHADSEAIGALREALSERAMERDEARRELEAMRNSGSWHKDDAIDRIEEAAGTAGFAQGIEAAADEIRKRWATTHAELEEYVRALSPTPQADPVREAAEMPRAWLDVMDERTRQIAVEGWSPMHDDAHEYGEMAHAAACYTICAAQEDGHEAPPPPAWPWDAGWWKPTDPRRDLVKAGALILAEIERLDRALAQKGE